MSPQTKGDSPLHSLRWLRVILDEGHAIRNPNAQQTKAVLDLEAERRWVLTGNDSIVLTKIHPQICVIK